MKTIQAEVADIRIDDKSILHIVYRKGAFETKESITENVLTADALRGSKGNNKVIFDIRKAIGATKEARDMVKSNDYSHLFVAVAIIVDNSLSRMIGNFFVGFNRPELPLKIFTDVDEAVEWLDKNFTY